jgi:hypothetical protein
MRMDRQITKLTAAFPNFAKAPKYETKCTLRNKPRFIVTSDQEGKSFVYKTGNNTSIKRCLFLLILQLNWTRQAVTWAAGRSTEERETSTTVSSAFRRAARRYKILSSVECVSRWSFTVHTVCRHRDLPLDLTRRQFTISIRLDAHFNLSKTITNLLYIRNQFVPRSKHFPPRL